MRRIGIVTTSNAINYGAVLQAYALKTSLTEATGATVEIVNYTGNPQIMGRKIYRTINNIKAVLYNIIVFLNVPYRKKRKKLINLFDGFKKNELQINMREVKNIQEFEKYVKFDILIAGSDQIWNLNLINDEVFFLGLQKNNTSCLYYSYATSISEEMTKEQQNQITERIKKFKKISIREKDTAKKLEKITERVIRNDIDPVFLLTKERWKIFSESNIRQQVSPYVFVFMIGHDSGDQLVCDFVSKYYNFPVKILNLHPFNRLKADEVINTVTPKEFIKLIFEAEVIITDSFHATSFSIIANKCFYCIKRSTRNNRVENLFDILNLPNRFISTELKTDLSHVPYINYETVNENIQCECKKAFEYFKNIMEEYSID